MPKTELLDLDSSSDDEITVPDPQARQKLPFDELAAYTPPADDADDDSIEVEIVGRAAPADTPPPEEPPPLEGEEPEPEPEPALARAAEDEDKIPEDAPTSWQKRLKREIEVKHRERQARVDAENEAAELRKKLAAYERDKESGDLDAKITEAQEKYKKARIDGDVDAEAEAVSALTDLRAQKAVLKTRPADAPAATPSAAPNEAKDAWYRRHAHWFDKQGYDTQSDAAVAISNEVLAEGKLRPNDPRFYEEVDKRLVQRVRLPQAQARPQPTAAPARASAPSSGAVRQENGKTRVTLDDGDFAMMHALRIDTTDPKAVKRYAIEKARKSK